MKQTIRFDRATKGNTKVVIEPEGGARPFVTEASITTPENRASLAKQIAKEFPAIDREELEDALCKEAARPRGKESAKLKAEPTPSPVEAPPTISPEDRAEAKDILSSADLLDQIETDITALGVTGEFELKRLMYLLGVSRLLDKPLAAIVQGSSSTGKSYVPETVARMFPSEAVLFAHQLTPQALVHMPPGALKHRWIVAGERSRRQDDEIADATKQIREMLSSGRLTKLMPMKVDGVIVTREIVQEGPIAFTESTTRENLLDEDCNRCLMLSTDESREQNRRIIETQSLRAEGREIASVDALIRRHHAIQRILAEESPKVIVPFASRLGPLIADQRETVRREYLKLLAVIKASALLHCFQRWREPDGRVFATREDYAIARELAGSSIAAALGGGPTEATAEFWTQLRLSLNVGDPFTAHQACEATGKSSRRTNELLPVLQGCGVIEIIEPNRGRKPAVWRVARDELPQCAELPDPSAVFD